MRVERSWGLSVVSMIVLVCCLWSFVESRRELMRARCVEEDIGGALELKAGGE